MSAGRFLNELRSHIRADLLVEGTIRLIEDDVGSTLGGVLIKKSGRPLVIRPDRCALRPGGVSANDRLFPLTRLDDGRAKHCDYVIAHAPEDPHEAVLYLLFVELKSGEPGEARRQIENTRLLIDSLVAATEHHGRAAQPTIVRRGITFAARARTPKGVRCPYDENRRMPDLRCATLPPAEYHLEYFCDDQTRS